jgi:hypothetical protein
MVRQRAERSAIERRAIRFAVAGALRYDPMGGADAEGSRPFEKGRVRVTKLLLAPTAALLLGGLAAACDGDETNGGTPPPSNVFSFSAGTVYCDDVDVEQPTQDQLDTLTLNQASFCGYSHATGDLRLDLYAVDANGQQLPQTGYLWIFVSDMLGPGTYVTGLEEAGTSVGFESDHGTCDGVTYDYASDPCAVADAVRCTIEVSETDLPELELPASGARADGRLEATVTCGPFFDFCGVNASTHLSFINGLAVGLELYDCEIGA